MPHIRVVFYKDADGTVPVLEWLARLRTRNAKAFAKCLVRVERLEQAGHELRRPEADVLRDGIYELRAKEGTVQYRILYFFHGRTAAVLAHCLTKEDRVPDADIKRALQRKRQFESDPSAHTHVQEGDRADR
jgi:phage-related protein